MLKHAWGDHEESGAFTLQYGNGCKGINKCFCGSIGEGTCDPDRGWGRGSRRSFLGKDHSELSPKEWVGVGLERVVVVVGGVVGRTECQPERPTYVKTQSFVFRELKALWPHWSRDCRGREDEAREVTWNQIVQSSYFVLKVMRGHRKLLSRGVTCLAYHFRKIAMVAGEGWIRERERGGESEDCGSDRGLSWWEPELRL